MSTFRIQYDDQPNEVVDKVSAALAAHGLKIEYDGDGGDGFEDYKIVRAVDEENKEENK